MGQTALGNRDGAQSLSLFFLTPAQGVAVSFWAVNGSSPIVPAQWDVGRVWGKAFPKSQERAGVGQAYGLGLGAEAKSSSAPFWLGKPCPSLSFPIYKMWETLYWGMGRVQVRLQVEGVEEPGR